ncbi:MAG: DNA double-strand break repair nuclease NurA [Synechococcales cyanobacterium CRU_2_2]|nr:DNA double-strand break repair nuclease NurA [Synechococcales cyanobacterium CRU_2_2]
MLDLTKLALQMQGISNHLAQEAAASRTRLERAQHLVTQAAQHQAILVQMGQEWRDRLSFTAAEPMEPMETKVAIATPPAQHTVLATDGSQIAPSHHEIAYCYLINIGRVVLHYGQNRQPLLDSLPEVFYQSDDLYGARKWGIGTEEWMGYRRTVTEVEMLAELAAGIASSPPQASLATLASTLAPTLALVDGSLIYWFLDGLPGEARDRILPPILEAWEQLQALRVPFVGYVSASRSTESLNFLRLQSCPYDFPDCATHCEGRGDGAPCQVFTPLRDVTLWSTMLRPGERGPLWRSSAKILAEYGLQQTIYFCYVHVGAEIARLEFPAWVGEDATLLGSALSLVLGQVHKGYGYPVALAEAHNQAVVRGGDRARFFAMLERQMVKAGLRNVGTSFKEARKRGSIA